MTSALSWTPQPATMVLRACESTEAKLIHTRNFLKQMGPYLTKIKKTQVIIVQIAVLAYYLRSLIAIRKHC